MRLTEKTLQHKRVRAARSQTRKYVGREEAFLCSPGFLRGKYFIDTERGLKPTNGLIFCSKTRFILLKKRFILFNFALKCAILLKTHLFFEEFGLLFRVKNRNFQQGSLGYDG